MVCASQNFIKSKGASWSGGSGVTMPLISRNFTITVNTISIKIESCKAALIRSRHITASNLYIEIRYVVAKHRCKLYLTERRRDTIKSPHYAIKFGLVVAYVISDRERLRCDFSMQIKIIVNL
jgi:hypothetical protein